MSIGVRDSPWAQPWKAVSSRLDTEPEAGLPEEEAARRLGRYGPNRLRQHPRRSGWSILLDQFKSLIVALLIAAAAVAFLFGQTLEGWAVLVVIALNTAIGFFTERRAVRSMEALHALGSVTTRVRRQERIQEIPAETLVPGDIVLIEGGDVVTADLRLTQASKLQADESALTGESLPVGKSVERVPVETPLAERASMLYKGTAVTRGAGEGVVVATGMATELGAVSALVAEAEEEATPLEKRLDHLGHRLIWATLAVTALVTLTGTLAGKGLVLMIETGLALAVAAIPEGLPVVATIALARGMRRMARRHALINRLSSVETLGATSVICTDKTGTLTENRMTATRIVVASGTVEIATERGAEAFRLDGKPVDAASQPVLSRALETGVLCNNASLAGAAETDATGAVGDPLEVALLVAGAKAGLSRERVTSELPEVREEAFDPDARLMATVHAAGDGYRIAVKGGPEAVLAASASVFTEDGQRTLSATDRSSWARRNEALAEAGLRVIALATKEADSCDTEPYEGLAFIALVGLIDPPRTEVRTAIEQCRRAGIEVVMVTGDQPATALGIGRELGLVTSDEERLVHGDELKPPHLMSQAERQAVLRAGIFARVSPRQKLDLIELHQQAGHIVAMTGDGVNDAPALKKADIGIAMGLRGTQVAQEASDMVLQDDAFSTIVSAVEEGRAIFDNIRTFVLYLMSCNVSEVMVVGVASLVGATLPILPLQILFLNLVTDVFPALALGVGPGAENLMERAPRDPDEPILGRAQWLRIAFYGAVFTATVLGALVLAERWLDLPTDQAVTVSFLTLAFAQLWHVFNMRAPEAPVIRNEVTRNPYVWAALALCAGLILGAVFVPRVAEVLGVEAPGARGWSLALGMSLAPLLLGQVLKRILKATGRSLKIRHDAG